MADHGTASQILRESPRSLTNYIRVCQHGDGLRRSVVGLLEIQQAEAQGYLPPYTQTKHG